MSGAVLETTGYRAPLALRATDAATGADVGDGLVATAWPAADPGAARTARPSPFSSLFGFATLPGLRAQEYARSSGSAPLLWPVPAPLPFLVGVVDLAGRFLPEVFSVTAPRTTPVPVTLYSSPSRPHPPGWAVVAGEVSTGPSAPAGWAFVALSDGVTSYETAADPSGRFVHHLPYPEALPVLANPPSGNGIADVTWPVTLSVRYEPGALQWPAAPAPDGPPDVDSLRSQAHAQISTGGGIQPSVVATLQYGVPLTLALNVIPA